MKIRLNAAIGTLLAMTSLQASAAGAADWLEAGASYNRWVGAVNAYSAKCSAAIKEVPYDRVDRGTCDSDRTSQMYWGLWKTGDALADGNEVEAVYGFDHFPARSEPLYLVSRDATGKDSAYQATEVTADHFERLIPSKTAVRAKCDFFENRAKTKVDTLRIMAAKDAGKIEILQNALATTEERRGFFRTRTFKTSDPMNCSIVTGEGDETRMDCELGSVRVSVDLSVQTERRSTGGGSSIFDVLGCFAGGPCGGTTYEVSVLKAKVTTPELGEVEETCQLY